jgi:hypothetical protein
VYEYFRSPFNRDKTEQSDSVHARKKPNCRPKGYRRRDIYAHYREAWHLLREPDGLVFG